MDNQDYSGLMVDQLSTESQRYPVGLMCASGAIICMHCMCIVICGILENSQNFMLMVIDLVFFRLFSRFWVGASLTVQYTHHI